MDVFDKNGKLVDENFSEGLKPVKVKNKWGYADKQGNIVNRSKV
jgi:hypothetical protein